MFAIFNQTHAPTSRKYAAGQSILMPNSSKTLQGFWWHFFVFALEKKPQKCYIFGFFLPLEEPFWNRNEYSKFVREYSIFWSHFFVSALENKLLKVAKWLLQGKYVHLLPENM